METRHITELIKRLDATTRATPPNHKVQLSKIRMSYIIATLRSYKELLDAQQT